MVAAFARDAPERKPAPASTRTMRTRALGGRRAPLATYGDQLWAAVNLASGHDAVIWPQPGRIRRRADGATKEPHERGQLDRRISAQMQP